MTIVARALIWGRVVAITVLWVFVASLGWQRSHLLGAVLAACVALHMAMVVAETRVRIEGDA